MWVMTRSLVNNEDEVSLAILMLTFHANGLNDVFPLALLDYLRFLIEKGNYCWKEPQNPLGGLEGRNARWYSINFNIRKRKQRFLWSSSAFITYSWNHQPSHLCCSPFVFWNAEIWGNLKTRIIACYISSIYLLSGGGCRLLLKHFLSV